MHQSKKKELLQCNELIECYLKALENYCKKKSRKGCSPTFFTNFRHAFKEYPTLSKLHKLLNKQHNTISALSLVVDHFVAKTATFNHHSFNNYFIDELKSSVIFKNIEWDCFTPKAVKHYKGLLYRGDTRPPSTIFNIGFKEKYSSNFDSDYLKYCNGVWISTSKDINVAINYAISKENLILKYIRALLKFFKSNQTSTYVYVINYQGPDSFDLLKTGQARGLNFFNVFHKDRSNALKDKEVNIKGHIDPKHILGVYESRYDGSWLWTENLKCEVSLQKLKYH